MLARGRDVYNFRCYFCHGYSGDARTLATQQLRPEPRDFTAPPALTREDILKVLRDGSPGTAMKSFADVLPAEDREAVAAFVVDEFVTRKAPNTRYHTAENGWPDHQQRYGKAVPFALGELTVDMPLEGLPPEQAAGRNLFLEACATCHEPNSKTTEFSPHPLSHMGQVIRDEADLVSRPTVYGVHDLPLEIEGLTPLEARGQALFDDNCAFCHAKDGTGKNWIGTFLKPHARDLTDSSMTGHLDEETLKSVIRQGIPETSMPAWDAVLSDEQVDAVAAYIRRAFLAPSRRSPDGGTD